MKFDGTIPHVTQPFTGKRFTIVYFTRRWWLSVKPHTAQFVVDLGFLLPTEEYLGEGGKMAGAPSKMAGASVATC